jgi:nitroimidazol reductase NimA-like FMN-containing flavoprotein (pyridoxamine 5'-phosphate oxidase superfamily)
MQADLDKEHTEMLLKTHNVGRLACSVGGRPYIVPITYVYDDGYIYGHTNDGQKLAMMRQNPRVCFEVDSVTDFRTWQSAICWGRFEELQGSEMASALDLMLSRLAPEEPTEGHGKADEAAHRIKLRSLKGATYRIKVDELSGRYERP